MNSPCTKVCKIKEGICTGCHRTLEQIGAWGSMTDKERQEAMRELKWPVAVVDRVGIMQRLPPYTNLPEGTKLYTHPASADEHITVHEYTARMSLDALKFYTEWMQRHACGDSEPIEHHYAMQAIDELEALLSKQEQGQ